MMMLLLTTLADVCLLSVEMRHAFSYAQSIKSILARTQRFFPFCSRRVRVCEKHDVSRFALKHNFCF
jgi:hypothetical protein